jgi:hypothetical protein
VNDQISDPREPLCVVLAWRVTAGDAKFVALVRAEHERGVRACQDRAERDPRADDVPDIDRLVALAGCLANEMAGGAELTAPGAVDAPDTCVRRSLKAQPTIGLLFKNDSGRFRQLAEDFAASCQHEMKNLGADEEMRSKIAAEGPPDWLRAYDTRCTKIFKHSILRRYLEGRFKTALREICRGMQDGTIKGAGVPYPDERRARDIKLTEIIVDMIIDAGGLFRQGSHKAAPAWKWVTLAWGSVLEYFAAKQREDRKQPEPAAKKSAGLQSPARKRGRPPNQLPRVVAEMEAAIENGKFTKESLGEMKQEALKTTFRASRETCVKALKLVRSEKVGN